MVPERIIYSVLGLMQFRYSLPQTFIPSCLLEWSELAFSWKHTLGTENPERNYEQMLEDWSYSGN